MSEILGKRLACWPFRRRGGSCLRSTVRTPRGDPGLCVASSHWAGAGAWGYSWTVTHSSSLFGAEGAATSTSLLIPPKEIVSLCLPGAWRGAPVAIAFWEVAGRCGQVLVPGGQGARVPLLALLLAPE